MAFSPVPVACPGLRMVSDDPSQSMDQPLVAQDFYSPPQPRGFFLRPFSSDYSVQYLHPIPLPSAHLDPFAFLVADAHAPSLPWQKGSITTKRADISIALRADISNAIRHYAAFFLTLGDFPSTIEVASRYQQHSGQSSSKSPEPLSF